MDDLIVRGQEIGAVRGDIPLDTAQRLMHELGKVLSAGMGGEYETAENKPREKKQDKIEQFIAVMHDLSKRILAPKEDLECFTRF
jgi:hypothetical protein